MARQPMELSECPKPPIALAPLLSNPSSSLLIAQFLSLSTLICLHRPTVYLLRCRCLRREAACNRTDIPRASSSTEVSARSRLSSASECTVPSPGPAAKHSLVVVGISIQSTSLILPLHSALPHRHSYSITTSRESLLRASPVAMSSMASEHEMVVGPSGRSGSTPTTTGADTPIECDVSIRIARYRRTASLTLHCSHCPGQTKVLSKMGT